MPFKKFYQLLTFSYLIFSSSASTLDFIRVFLHWATWVIFLNVKLFPDVLLCHWKYNPKLLPLPGPKIPYVTWCLPTSLNFFPPLSASTVLWLHWVLFSSWSTLCSFLPLVLVFLLPGMLFSQDLPSYFLQTPVEMLSRDVDIPQAPHLKRDLSPEPCLMFLHGTHYST